MEDPVGVMMDPNQRKYISINDVSLSPHILVVLECTVKTKIIKKKQFF